MKYLLIVLTLYTATVHAEVYKWTDANGRSHYGSRPGAEQSESVELEGSTVESARFSPRVVLYATSWCGYCAKARAHFKSKHIFYSERDIETSASAKRDYDQLNGNGVPLILVDDQRLQGFNAEAFDALYQQQADAGGQ